MSRHIKIDQGIVIDCIMIDPDDLAGRVDTTPGQWMESDVGGIGQHYDADGDYFYYPKPYPSWTWNSTSNNWQPPVAFPSNMTDATVWNEDSQAWETE